MLLSFVGCWSHDSHNRKGLAASVAVLTIRRRVAKFNYSEANKGSWKMSVVLSRIHPIFTLLVVTHRK